MRKHEWILTNGKLCLSGYPIRIRQEASGFVLEHDGREDHHSAILGYLKYEAERRAGELAEFEPAIR